jgi:uncharacterized damage-inducible protein DinB
MIMMDIRGYITMLNRNTGELLNLVRNRDDETLNHRSFNSWSILQVLEHLLITEKYVIDLLSKPGEKLADKHEIKGSEKLHRLLVDMRARKVKAPDMLEPKDKIVDLGDFNTQFLKLRTSLAEKLEDGSIVVDQRVHSHPTLGEMTVSDWLHFLISHSRRHMEQIRDVLTALHKA